jgi:recombination protein RecT
MSNNLPAIRKTIQSPSIQNSIKTRIGSKADAFTTSLLDVIGEDNILAECDPMLIVKEALKAAGLDLPLNKKLGFAYVLPYKKKGGRPEPQFQMGYRGYIQLAIRTGLYKHLNADCIYEGECFEFDRIRGTLEITGQKTSDKAIGYFCYFELINGFQKAIAWTRKKVETHAAKYSKSYNSSFSPWKSDFDSMAKKTMVLQLIPKYGPMTIEMSQAMAQDRADFSGFSNDGQIQAEIDIRANQEPIDITPDHAPVYEIGPGPEPEPEPDGSQGEEQQAGPDF